MNDQNVDQSAQQFDFAIESNDPKQMMVVASENIGKPVGEAAVKAADLMIKGQKSFRDMVAPIEKAGGVGTPDGNIAAAKVAQTYFKQEDPKWGQALMYYLTGNEKMGQAIITGGDISTNIVPDVNGKMIAVTKNQLGKIINAKEIGGNVLSEQEFQQRAVGRQTYENLLTFTNQKKQQEINIDSMKKSQQVNNAYASAFPELGSKYGQLYDDLEVIKKKDLTSKEFADILRFASNSLGTADQTTKGLTILDQAQQNRSVVAGKTLTKDQTAALGLPAGVWKWTNRGIESEDGKISKSFDELKQSTSSENKSSELKRNFEQTQQNLIQSEKFKRLDSVEQKRLLNALETSYQIGSKQIELSREFGTPSFLVQPSSFDIADKFTMGQVKAVQGMFNAKAMDLYQQYASDVMSKSGGLVPDPKEIEAGFTRTPQYRELLKAAQGETNRLLNEKLVSVDVAFPKEEKAVPAPAKKQEGPGVKPKMSLKQLESMATSK